MAEATWTLPAEARCSAKSKACEGRGELQPDPYESDVYNRTVLRYLCGPCVENISADI